MEIRQLHTLIAISQLGSFAQAAEQLGYTQPTLTTHIQMLEKELNIKLFDRLGNRIRLTREGEVFLGYAERILRLTDEAAEAVSDKSAYGKIVIGASETFSVLHLPAILKELRQEHPNINIELQFGDINKFYNDLKNNVIDVAFMLAEKIDYPDLTTEILCAEPMSFIVSPEHRFAQQHSVAVFDLVTEDFIATQAGCAYRDYIERILEKSGITPRSFMKVKGIEAIKQFVISGLGVAILPAIYVKEEIADGLLSEVPWIGPEFGMYTQIVHHKNKWLSPGLQRFLELTRERFCQCK